MAAISFKSVGETEDSEKFKTSRTFDSPYGIKTPLQRGIVKTGLFIELPIGVEAQVRPRSGMAIKHGITVLNAPGTIDADYRGEIGVILVNLSDTPFTINHGDRIAQLVIAKHETIIWKQTDKLSDSARGTAGFGSTGIK